VQLPGAAFTPPAQSRAVLSAFKPGTARAFALRRRAHSRAPGPESLSLGSLGVARREYMKISAFSLIALIGATLQLAIGRQAVARSEERRVGKGMRVSS